MAPVQQCGAPLARFAKFLLGLSQRAVQHPTLKVPKGAQAAEENAGAGVLSFLPQRCGGRASSYSSLTARSEGASALYSSSTARANAGGAAFSSLTACAAAALGMAVLCSEPASASPAATEQAGSVPDVKAFKGPAVTKGGRSLTNLRIFVGYDPREDEAYEVCRYSILKHATLPVEVVPIRQAELRATGLYTRGRDSTESTEFSFTRFLTPFLAGFDGWALFVDCDFLYTGDVRELAQMVDERYALMCVKHDYTPRNSTKMDGVPQTCYPRKNWSSMVLYNCSHPKNRVLTPDVVNSQTGAFLHRFLWLDDEDIGAVPFTWNFLVGHHPLPPAGAPLPRAIHFTSGGPWFDSCRNCDFSDLWLRERDELQQMQRVLSLDLESQLQEVGALQRLVLFCLEEKVLPGAGGSAGPVAAKEEPLVEGAGLTA